MVSFIDRFFPTHQLHKLVDQPMLFIDKEVALDLTCVKKHQVDPSVQDSAEELVFAAEIIESTSDLQTFVDDFKQRTTQEWESLVGGIIGKYSSVEEDSVEHYTDGLSHIFGVCQYLSSARVTLEKEKIYLIRKLLRSYFEMDAKGCKEKLLLLEKVMRSQIIHFEYTEQYVKNIVTPIIHYTIPNAQSIEQVLQQYFLVPSQLCGRLIAKQLADTFEGLSEEQLPTYLEDPRNFFAIVAHCKELPTQEKEEYVTLLEEVKEKLRNAQKKISTKLLKKSIPYKFSKGQVDKLQLKQLCKEHGPIVGGAYALVLTFSFFVPIPLMQGLGYSLQLSLKTYPELKKKWETEEYKKIALDAGPVAGLLYGAFRFK